MPNETMIAQFPKSVVSTTKVTSGCLAQPASSTGKNDCHSPCASMPSLARKRGMVRSWLLAFVPCTRRRTSAICALATLLASMMPSTNHTSVLLRCPCNVGTTCLTSWAHCCHTLETDVCIGGLLSTAKAVEKSCFHCERRPVSVQATDRSISSPFHLDTAGCAPSGRLLLVFPLFSPSQPTSLALSNVSGREPTRGARPTFPDIPWWVPGEFFIGRHPLSFQRDCGGCFCRFAHFAHVRGEQIPRAGVSVRESNSWELRL